MEKRRCAGCGKAFSRRPQVPDQEYCGKVKCRRARRRRWQRAKRQNDADYRDNQARVQRAWAGENSGYWQIYRSGHPDYAQIKPGEAAPTGSPAACGESCKDGLVKSAFDCSIRDLRSGAPRRGEACKDGLVNSGNHFAFKGIALGIARGRCLQKRTRWAEVRWAAKRARHGRRAFGYRPAPTGAALCQRAADRTASRGESWPAPSNATVRSCRALRLGPRWTLRTPRTVSGWC
jgi:hypothetical protein